MAGDGRNPDRDIFEQLYEHTAETANDNRPEKRIALNPDNHFYAFWSHALHHNSGDFSGRKSGGYTFVHAAEGTADIDPSKYGGSGM